MSNVVSCDQDSNKEVSATKSQHSTAADIVPYKDPSPHQMLAAAQSTSTAVSSCSTMKEPLRPTFIFNSCNFSSCPITFAGNANQSAEKTDDLDGLLEGISIEQLFDC